MKVALYARYSTDMQREASVEDQLRLCREYAKRQGWDVVDSFTDHAKTGANLLRPGIQSLVEAAMQGRFNAILAESLDRLSRDPEDMAGLHKRMSFRDVRLFTVADGEVSVMHVGLKGTMGALYRMDLADKTHRGLRGRIAEGRSAGGKCYGYDVVAPSAQDDKAERGERRINNGQAAVVRRIFTDYAAGVSPRAIAHALNREKVPGPSGKAWGASTIHGNPKRGTGILNNELYIGRLVWNRLRYLTDPDTGKRISRLNPEEDWAIVDVPELRIIDDELWAKAKARQADNRLDRKANPANPLLPHRRNRYLFSELTKCGQCGGGFSMISATHMGCSAARNKGTCENRKTIARTELESRILTALRHHLMDPRLFGEFCDAFTAELNRTRMDQSHTLDAARNELDQIPRKLSKLVDALTDGGPMQTLVAEIKRLEGRQAELQDTIATADEPPPLLHPGMADVYRQEIANLCEALNDEEARAEAGELIRALIDRIVITPEEDGMVLDLQGSLAGILTLASKGKKPANGTQSVDGLVSQVSMVAGAGFEPATFRL